jgi:hypothetical protein
VLLVGLFDLAHLAVRELETECVDAAAVGRGRA